MADIATKPTIADAFEAGRKYYGWVDSVHRSTGREDVFALPLAQLLTGIGVDADYIRSVIRQQPAKSLRLGRNFSRKPRAESEIDAAVRTFDPALLPWFLLGKRFSEIQKTGFAKTRPQMTPGWFAWFRKAMQEAGVSPKDRDAVEAQLRNAMASDDGRPWDEFELAAERLRDSAKSLELEKAAMNNTVARPPTSQEKLAFLIAILAFAIGGFYLFREQWWLVFLWLAFFVVGFPLVWAFVFRADDIPGADLKVIYETGVKSIPLIGKLFVSSAPKIEDTRPETSATKPVPQKASGKP